VPGTLKRLSVATLVATCIGAVVLPAAANADPVEDLLGGIENTVNDTVDSVNGLLGGNGGSGGSGGGSPAPAPAPAPQAEGGSTEPGITGTNPHGEGQVLGLSVDVIDLPGEDDVVIGQSRGDQDEDGNYHGSVVPLSVLGFDIAVVTTEEGETATSPLTPINDILDEICTGTTVCLQLLDFSSETTGTGSNNSFEAASADIAEGLVSANVLESDGNINEAGGCQTAEGSANTDVGVGNDTITVDALQSSSESQACNDGSESTDSDSQVLNLGPLDALNPLTLLGCDPTAEDDEFDVAGLVGGVCNGDDTNGSQAEAPYNVRKALGLDVLPLLSTLAPDIDGLASADGANSESLAQAPGDDAECPDPNNPDCPTDECPDPTNPDCPDGSDDCPDPSNPDCPDIEVSPSGPPGSDDDGDGPGGPGGPSAESADDDRLAFTGADMGLLGAIGLGVMAIGLALMALADRRRNAVHG
jgi:hypothetical protein